MKLPIELEDKTEKLIALCNQYKVKRMFAFGSMTKGNFNPQTSDIDLIVELEDLPPSEKGEILMDLWSELEDLFARKVDLLTNLNIKNPYLRNEIENTKFLIYDRASQKIFI
jgi:predicted nucleotidyltransferase